MLRWTPRILAIWDLEMPLDNKFRTFLAFFESLSFFDSAENGRQSFFPEALRLARDDFVRWDIRFLSISAARLKANTRTLDGYFVSTTGVNTNIIQYHMLQTIFACHSLFFFTLMTGRIPKSSCP